MQRWIKLYKKLHTAESVKILESTLDGQPHPLRQRSDAGIYERNLIFVSHNPLLFISAKVHIPFISTNILYGKMFSPQFFLHQKTVSHTEGNTSYLNFRSLDIQYPEGVEVGGSDPFKVIASHRP